LTTRKFVESVEKTIDSSPVILSSDIQKHFGPTGESVYIRGHLVFIDSSILDLALFATERDGTLLVDKYRFHYMNGKRDMLFRYDNAPHHPEVSSNPDHKHTPGNILPSGMPSLKDILNEISAKIIE